MRPKQKEHPGSGSKKTDLIAAVSHLLPAVIAIHKLPAFTLEYMSPLGLKLLNQDWSQISGMSSDDYHQRYFNVEHARIYVPRILRMLESNSDELTPFFQQVRTSKTRAWDWYMSCIKILERDENGNPDLSITIAMQVDPEHYFTAKAARLLDENLFLKKHHHLYNSLTKQERSVLRLLALGRRNRAIAGDLNISPSTVETHRKRIKKKLKARTVVEMMEYARVFRLI